jgi:hypothetical protein
MTTMRLSDGLVLKRTYDPRSSRQSINGEQYVLHCHHFATLYTQLADDCGMLDGKKLMAEVAEDTFYDILRTYYAEHQVTGIPERVLVAEEYYAAMGLGLMKIRCAGPETGEVELLASHIDQGWVKKWGQREEPVNFMTSGFVAGAFSAIFDRAPRTYEVRETRSIVAGADTSKFEVSAS